MTDSIKSNLIFELSEPNTQIDDIKVPFRFFKLIDDNGDEIDKTIIQDKIIQWYKNFRGDSKNRPGKDLGFDSGFAQVFARTTCEQNPHTSELRSDPNFYSQQQSILTHQQSLSSIVSNNEELKYSFEMALCHGNSELHSEYQNNDNSPRSDQGRFADSGEYLLLSEERMMDIDSSLLSSPSPSPIHMESKCSKSTPEDPYYSLELIIGPTDSELPLFFEMSYEMTKSLFDCLLCNYKDNDEDVNLINGQFSKWEETEQDGIRKKQFFYFIINNTNIINDFNMYFVTIFPKIAFNYIIYNYLKRNGTITISDIKKQAIENIQLEQYSYDWKKITMAYIYDGHEHHKHIIAGSKNEILPTNQIYTSVRRSSSSQMAYIDSIIGNLLEQNDILISNQKHGADNSIKLKKKRSALRKSIPSAGADNLEEEKHVILENVHRNEEEEEEKIDPSNEKVEIIVQEASSYPFSSSDTFEGTDRGFATMTCGLRPHRFSSFLNSSNMDNKYFFSNEKQKISEKNNETDDISPLFKKRKHIVSEPEYNVLKTSFMAINNEIKNSNYFTM
jgi:hypothetical protein